MNYSKSMLEKIFFEHKGYASDKWEQYLSIYDSLLNERVTLGEPLHLLEIGIQNGGSLEIWSKYLPANSKITGIDIDPLCAKLKMPPGVSIHIGDASSPNELERMLKEETFDIIVDDGSHRSPEIISSFKACFDRLKPGGIYIIEDLHASYMEHLEGGFQREGSAIEWLKRFIDLLHLDYLSDKEIKRLESQIGMDLTSLRREICHVSVFDSVIAIEKFLDDKDRPYRRIMSGTESIVSDVTQNLSKMPLSHLRSLVMSSGALESFGERLFNELASAIEQCQIYKQREAEVRAALAESEQVRQAAEAEAQAALVQKEQILLASEAATQAALAKSEQALAAKAIAESALELAEQARLAAEAETKAALAQKEEIRFASETEIQAALAKSEQALAAKATAEAFLELAEQAKRSAMFDARAAWDHAERTRQIVEAEARGALAQSEKNLQIAQAETKAALASAEQVRIHTEIELQRRVQIATDRVAHELEVAKLAETQAAQEELRVARENTQALSNQLNAMLNSTSWRAGEPMRRLGSRLSPGTRQRFRRIAGKGWRTFNRLPGIRSSQATTVEIPAAVNPVVQEAPVVDSIDHHQLIQDSGLFDAQYYQNSNPDTAGAQQDPLTHYLTIGGQTGLDPSEAFSSSDYYERYPDVAQAKINPLLHYLQHGKKEGRSINRSKPAQTSVSVAVTPVVQETPVVESIDHHQLIQDSGLFDAQYYQSSNPDTAAAQQDPLTHYLTIGGQSGLDPSEAFSSSAYYERYPDVAQAKLNPLLHYLQHGKQEGRSITSGKAAQPLVRDLFLERFPALRPLPAFEMPSEGKRLTIVTDSVGASSLFGGVGTAIILGAILSNRWGAALRVVTRQEAPDAAAIGMVLKANGLHLDRALQIQFVPENGQQMMGYFNDEVFMTTSWWTTRPTLEAVGYHRVFYLLQEDERMFYPYGDERLLCADVLNDEKVPVVVNTHLLFNHLADRKPALKSLRERGIAFEPAFPAKDTSAKQRITTEKRKFFFYSRPHNARNLFWRGAEVLSSAIESGVLDPKIWDFYWVGRGTPALRLPRGVVPHRIEALPWIEYQALVSEMDAALVLMDTPHPSYPPLDLAAAGVAVLTNNHLGKEDLSFYSKNILISSTRHEDLVKGLSQVSELAQNDLLRAENRVNDAINRSWESALTDVVDHLSKIF